MTSTFDVNDFNTRLKNAGRNDPCPCGSQKKYKKCHLRSDEEAAITALRAEEARNAAEAAEIKTESGGTDSKDSSSDSAQTKKKHHTKEHLKGFSHRGSSQMNLPRKSGSA